MGNRNGGNPTVIDCEFIGNKTEGLPTGGHDVDYDKERHKKANEVPIDRAVKAIRLGLVADKHDAGKGQCHEAHLQITDDGQHGRCRNGYDEQHKHGRAKTKQTPTLNAVVFVKAIYKLASLLTLLIIREPLDRKELGSHPDGYERRHNHEGQRFPNKFKKTDVRGRLILRVHSSGIQICRKRTYREQC